LTSRIKRNTHFIFENPEYGTKSMPRKSPANYQARTNLPSQRIA
jgi:hypothetical protein